MIPPKQQGALTTLLFALLTLALCGAMLFRRDVVFGQPGMNDVIAAFVPFHAFLRRAIGGGEWPLWNPFICGGMPAAMFGQIGLFYPLNWASLALESHIAMNCQLALHLFLSFTLTRWIARRLGLSEPGAIACALAWTLSGTMATRVLSGHFTIIQALAWFPLGWGGLYRILVQEPAAENDQSRANHPTDVAVGRDRRMDWVAAIGGFTAMGLCGAPQIWMLALIFAAAQTLFSVLWRPANSQQQWAMKGRMAGRAAIMAAIVILLCAAEWTPVAAAGRATDRAKLKKEFNESILEMTASKLLTIPFPNLFGDNLESKDWGAGFFGETMPGIGLTGLALALMFSWRASSRRLAWAAALTALLSLWLAFGSRLGLYWLFKVALPPLRITAGPARGLFAFSWALSLLAGMGVDGLKRALEDRPESFRSILRIFIAAGVMMGAMAGVFALLGRGQWKDPATVWCIARSALLAGAAIPALLALKGRVPLNIIAWLFAGLLLVDLLGIHQRYFCCGPIYPQGRTPEAIREYLAGVADGGRAMRVIMEQPNDALENGYEDVNGYGVAMPADFVQCADWLSGRSPHATHRVVFNRPTPSFCRWFAINYLITYSEDPGPGQDWNLICAKDGYSLWKSERPYPRAEALPFYRGATRAEAARLVRSPAPESVMELSVEGLEPDFSLSSGSAQQDSAQDIPSEASLLRRSVNKREFSASLPVSGWLLMHETFDPGWRVKVDDRPARLYRAQYCLCATPLSPGRHRVELIYDPISFRLGWGLSALTALGLLAFALVSRLRQYKQKQRQLLE